MPLTKKKFRPHEHINILRKSIAFVAIFAYIFSALYPQNQPILMFFAVTGAIWMGGAGSCIIGGLYTKWDNAVGACGALITGSVIGLIGVFIAPIWHGFLNITQNVFPTLYANYVTIENGVTVYGDFPLNGQYIKFLTMISAILMYILLSNIFKTKPFNLDKMLYRGKYALETDVEKEVKTEKKQSFFEKLCGITSEFTKGDKFWAYLMIWWNMLHFAFFIIWCLISLYYIIFLHHHISDHAWFIVMFYSVVVNMVLSVPCVIWFTVGGVIDIRKLYRDLSVARRDDRDNGSN